MIEKHFLFPEYYVAKEPVCDNCKITLKNDNLMLASYPPKWQYRCPKCDKIYEFYEADLKGEWKWRTI